MAGLERGTQFVGGLVAVLVAGGVVALTTSIGNSAKDPTPAVESQDHSDRFGDPSDVDRSWNDSVGDNETSCQMTATLVGGKIVVKATVKPPLRASYIKLNVTTDNQTHTLRGLGHQMSLDPFQDQAVAEGQIGYPTKDKGHDSYIDCTPNPLVMPR